VKIAKAVEEKVKVVTDSFKAELKVLSSAFDTKIDALAEALTKTQAESAKHAELLSGLAILAAATPQILVALKIAPAPVEGKAAAPQKGGAKKAASPPKTLKAQLQTAVETSEKEKAAAAAASSGSAGSSASRDLRSKSQSRNNG
jgi:hypothetical protein